LSDKVIIQLSSQWIGDYCQEMKRSTATVEKRLVALDALLTFISKAIDPAFMKNESYEQIKVILSTHLEQARTELMEEGTLRLARALQQHDVAQVAKLFITLSRSGFWEVLTQVFNRMDEGLQAGVTAWAFRWLDETKSRGEQASPYPDTINFAAAGISIEEYTVMTDICHYLSTNTSH
jgi:hypothetical protein